LNVGAELLESGADVRPTVGIVDRGGLEESWYIGHVAIILQKSQLNAFASPPAAADGSRVEGHP
jgi:hypothetical protein